MDTHATPSASASRGIPVLHRGLALSALGALLALALSPDGSAARTTGSVALWVSDRDADQVHGLGADLVPLRTVTVAAPTEVEARADGGAWVLSAEGGGPLGAHRLVRLGADGTQLASTLFGPPLDLAVVDGEDALVVELGLAGLGRLWRVAADGTAALVLEEPGLACASGSGTHVLAGTSAGEAILLARHVATPLARRALGGGPLGDVAPAEQAGAWWALDVGGSARLLRLAPDLTTAWSAPVGLHPLHLIEVPGEERVWIADTTAARVRRFGPGGTLEIDRHELRLSGLDRGASWLAGGLVCVAPGALLHLDAQGRPAPGQGGFRFLVDAARVPAP